METLVKNTSILAALLALAAVPAAAQLVSSDPVAAVDNIPPAPVGNLLAFDASSGEKASVSLSWDLSADDAVSFATFGQAVVPRGGVQGYNIYRAVEGGELERLSTVGPGVDEYFDESVEKGISYIYEVRPFDLDNESLLSVEPGSAADLARRVEIGGVPDVVVVKTFKASMKFDSNLNVDDQSAVDLFVGNFVASLAQLLGIDPRRITVRAVRSGSVIVDFEIADPETGTQEPTAEAALAALEQQVETGTEAFEALGPVLDFSNETSTTITAVVQPIDPGGNPVLGWFSRQGDRVGFDDFFLFADNFGRRRGEFGFDSQFDLSRNGQVDFDDFFLFADNFGRLIANASEVRSSLGL